MAVSLGWLALAKSTLHRYNFINRVFNTLFTLINIRDAYEHKAKEF
jgi:hypothetical protein